MSGALLKVNNLSLTSLHGSIVDHLDFEIKRGEIVALTGRSGSGKTSIAHAILNVLPQGIIRTSGNFAFTKKEGSTIEFPNDIDLWSQLRGRHIAFIQQDVFGAFDPVIKIGKQMLMIVNELKGPDPRYEAEMKQTLDEAGVTDIPRIWNSYPHQLSGGQLQRCLLAFTIILRPELLIADEPTSAIDKINQVELLDLFSMIRSKYDMAILCISHEPAVVNYLAEREVSLNEKLWRSKTVEDRQIIKPVSNKLLAAKDLTHVHRYGGLKEREGATISNLNFQIGSGECVGVIGESGSGKSTFAKMLVGLLTPSQGQLILNGKVVHFESSNEIKRLRASVQLVMQDGRGTLHPFKTIGELLREVAVNKDPGLKELENKLVNVLNSVGLPEDVLHKKSGNLSGGECLRVSIARALLMEPEVLICDESTSSLDPQTTEGILDLLEQLIRENGLAVIFISHDEYAVRRLAHEILVFYEGKIVDRGQLSDLSRSTNAVTKRIFSSQATLSGKRNL